MTSVSIYLLLLCSVKQLLIFLTSYHLVRNYTIVTLLLLFSARFVRLFHKSLIHNV